MRRNRLRDRGSPRGKDEDYIISGHARQRAQRASYNGFGSFFPNPRSLPTTKSDTNNMIRRFQSPAAVIIGFECSDAAQGEYMVQEDDRMDGWDVSVSESQTPTLCADSLAAPPKGCVRQT